MNEPTTRDLWLGLAWFVGITVFMAACLVGVGYLAHVVGGGR